MIGFDEYQERTEESAVYPRHRWLSYLPLGLNGEAGEVAEKVKKVIRDGGGLNDDVRAAIVGECGDVLWYVAQLLKRLDVPMSECAKCNLAKLDSRGVRGVLHGSGDDR